MKKALLLFSLAFSVFAFSQKIKISHVDKFTKNLLVETSFEKISRNEMKIDVSGDRLYKIIDVGFKLINNQEYLRIKWVTNKVLALRDDSTILLLDNEGNTYSFSNSGFTLAGKGSGSANVFTGDAYGFDIFATGDLEQLEGKQFTDIRFHTTDGYVDFPIKPKDQNTISNTYKVFKKEVNK